MSDARAATDQSLALGRLQGFLDALARVNGFGDLTYTFSFELLPEAADLRAAVERSFDGDASRVVVEPIDDWQSVIRTTFSSWMFRLVEEFDRRAGECDCEFTSKVVASVHLHDGPFREEVVDDLLRMLTAIGDPRRVWSVHVETKSRYEASWRDFAFEMTDRRFLLHLGVDD